MTKPLKHSRKYVYESGVQRYPSAAMRFTELLYALDEAPGLTTRELAECLKWKEGTTRYYLSLCRRTGEVVKESLGNSRSFYFLSSCETRGVVMDQKRKRSDNLLDNIYSALPIRFGNGRRVAATLSICRGTLINGLRDLMDEGLVQRIGRGYYVENPDRDV